MQNEFYSSSCTEVQSFSRPSGASAINGLSSFMGVNIDEQSSSSCTEVQSFSRPSGASAINGLSSFMGEIV